MRREGRQSDMHEPPRCRGGGNVRQQGLESAAHLLVDAAAAWNTMHATAKQNETTIRQGGGGLLSSLNTDTTLGFRNPYARDRGTVLVVVVVVGLQRGVATRSRRRPHRQSPSTR